MRTGPIPVCKAPGAPTIVLVVALSMAAAASTNDTRTGEQAANGPVTGLRQTLHGDDDRDDDGNSTEESERPRRRDWRCAPLATAGDDDELDHGTAVLEATRTVGRYRVPAYVSGPTFRLYVRRRRPVVVGPAVYGTQQQQQQQPITAAENNYYGGPARAMAVPVIIGLPYGVHVSAEQDGRRNGELRLQEQVRRALQRAFAAEPVTTDEPKFPKIQFFDRK